MSRLASTLGRLDDSSDRLSPLVVKEVRQIVRGREFVLSFSLSLLAGLSVAFFGAADALAGNSGAGAWTFMALLGCLGFLGLAIVPIGAFGALRNERMEHTLELITLTALSPRRIVIGKLMAQTVKLVTLFAAIAPFMAMSFLLGGIDFVTILASVVVLFMWSLWVAALCLFFSTAFSSRAMSMVVFAAVGLLVFFTVGVGRMFILTRGIGPGVIGLGMSAGVFDWTGLVIVSTLWCASLVNLVLLADNRLSLPTEDSVTPLRLGFFAQFLLIVGWALFYVGDPAAFRIAGSLAATGSVLLAVVALFVVSEELTIPRRVVTRMRTPSRWRWVLVAFGPGAGRGAAYVAVQMVMLMGAVSVLGPRDDTARWLLAALSYICFFTGVPIGLWWLFAPARATPLKLRVAVLLTVAALSIVPDIVHYLVWRPEVLDLKFSARHLLSPFRALSDWDKVERSGWTVVPYVLGLIGVGQYFMLMRLGLIKTEQSAPARMAAAARTEETGLGTPEH